MQSVRSPLVKTPIKAPTGIAGFDEITGGGLPRGRSALCRAHLAARHEIEVVDMFREPEHALANGIFMPPTLVGLAPLPARTTVATLSLTQPLFQALGL